MLLGLLGNTHRRLIDIRALLNNEYIVILLNILTLSHIVAICSLIDIIDALLIHLCDTRLTMRLTLATIPERTHRSSTRIVARHDAVAEHLQEVAVDDYARNNPARDNHKPCTNKTDVRIEPVAQRKAITTANARTEHTPLGIEHSTKSQ